MASKGITLKVARKKAGTISRARVRSVVNAVYAAPSTTPHPDNLYLSNKVLVTITDKKIIAK